MNKKEIITSAVMSLVCVLMLIGFTMAWYTNNQSNPTVTGIDMLAAETDDIIIALESGGEDISVLASNDIEGDEYADIGLDELAYVDGKMAPGAFGTVTFYVRPKNEKVNACSIVPVLGISLDGETWYYDGSEDESSGEAQGTGDESNDETQETGDESDDETQGTEDESGTDTSEEGSGLESLYEIAKSHIVFFADEEMTSIISEDNPLQLTWSEDDSMGEQEAVIYWKWYYEYPFTENENNLSEEEKTAKIEEYDKEDIMLGNNISDMRFRFTFTVQ